MEGRDGRGGPRGSARGELSASLVAPMRASVAPSFVLAAFAGLSLLAAVPREASAFCRSTTCAGDCTRDADGCKISGKELYWRSLCVGFSLQKDGTSFIPMDAVRAAVARSFVTWSDVPCENGELATIAFSPAADVSCHTAEYNPDGPNANIILFQENRWDYAGPGNTLAKTTVSYDTDTGEILDADIELNQAYNELTTGDENVVYDLESIMTHEIGHFIGIDHSPDPEATMYLAYEEGDTYQRDLAPDDVAAACAVYPTTRDVVCSTKPQGGFTKLCAAELEAAEDEAGCSVAPGSRRSSGSAFAPLLVVVAAAHFLRRRERRCFRA